jgi:hypothetical protein
MRKILVVLAVAAALAACRRGPTPQPIDSAALAPAQNPGAATPPAAQQPDAAQPSGQPLPNGAAPAEAAPLNSYGSPQPANGASVPGRPSPSGPPITGQPAAAPVPAPPPVAIPSGTPLRVRLEQTIDTRRNRAGDRFEATLIEPVVIDGQVVVPRGTPFQGHVTQASPSGRLKGRAVLGVELDSFRLNGVSYPVATSIDDRVSGRHRKRDWILIGGGAGLGTALGAIAGGPAGALIGAGAGAGAGTAGAYLTGKKQVALPAETALTFRLRRQVALSGA